MDVEGFVEIVASQEMDPLAFPLTTAAIAYTHEERARSGATGSIQYAVRERGRNEVRLRYTDVERVRPAPSPDPEKDTGHEVAETAEGS